MKILKARRPQQGVMITGGTDAHQRKTSKLHAMIIADSGYSLRNTTLVEVIGDETNIDSNTPDTTTVIDEKSKSDESTSQENIEIGKEDVDGSESSNDTDLSDSLNFGSIDVDLGDSSSTDI